MKRTHRVCVTGWWQRGIAVKSRYETKTIFRGERERPEQCEYTRVCVCVAAKPRNVPESSLASSDRCEPSIAFLFLLLDTCSFLSFATVKRPSPGDRARVCVARQGDGEPRRNGPFSAPKTGSVCFRALYRSSHRVYRCLWPGTRSVPERRAIEAPGRRIGRTGQSSNRGPEGASLETV